MEGIRLRKMATLGDEGEVGTGPEGEGERVWLDLRRDRRSADKLGGHLTAGGVADRGSAATRSRPPGHLTGGNSCLIP